MQQLRATQSSGLALLQPVWRPPSIHPPARPRHHRQESPSARRSTQASCRRVSASSSPRSSSTSSTRPALEQDLDPEEARAIIDPALGLMIDAVRRYDGHVVQSTGDGIFALFGAPVAHEDHPQRSLYAALRLQDEIRRMSDRLRTEGRTADRDQGRREHRRSGRPFDQDRRAADRIHADRSHRESRLAHAVGRQCRRHRHQRQHAQSGRRLFRASLLGSHARQGDQRIGSRL